MFLGKRLRSSFKKLPKLPRRWSFQAVLAEMPRSRTSKVDRRPAVIFGPEAEDKDDLITLPSACISWSILYSVLAERGLTPDAFKEAVKKMNSVTPHQFVYRGWDGKRGRGNLYRTKDHRQPDRRLQARNGHAH
jgi:hypothetical protein